MRLFVLVSLVLSMPLASSSALAALDIAAIDAASGKTGVWIESEKVYRLSFPRDDVKVTVDGVVMPPFVGLTSWASLMSGREKQAMMMGQIVCFADEVNPAISAALDSGLDVTSMSNHFSDDDPRVYFIHLHGEGTEAQLAGGVKNVLDVIKQIRTALPQPRKLPTQVESPPSAISTKPLDERFGGKGISQSGMYRIDFPREVSMPCACTASGAMGVSSWAAFYGTDECATVEGDIATTYGELQPVLKSLRKSGVSIVSIHNHMEAEAPRLIFVHYRASGRAVDLAAAIKTALGTQPRRQPAPAHQHHHHE